MSFLAEPGCVQSKEKEMTLRQLGRSTLPAVTGHRASGVFGVVAQAITHSARVLYWEGAQGTQESSPKVQLS